MTELHPTVERSLRLTGLLSDADIHELPLGTFVPYVIAVEAPTVLVEVEADSDRQLEHDVGRTRSQRPNGLPALAGKEGATPTAGFSTTSRSRISSWSARRTPRAYG